MSADVGEPVDEERLAAHALTRDDLLAMFEQGEPADGWTLTGSQGVVRSTRPIYNIGSSGARP